MEKKMKIYTRTPSGEKGLSPEEITSAYEYLESYVEIFNDKPMNSIYASVIRTNFMSKSNIETIRKRSDTIPSKEILDPFLYVERFFEILAKIRISLNTRINEESEDKYKLESLFSFYEQWGYLTKKQISLTHSLIRGNGHISTSSIIYPKEEVEIVYKIIAHLTTKGLSLAKKLASENSSFPSSTIKRILTIITESKRQKDTQDHLEKQEDESSSPKFLSLAEMRSFLST
jgi:uncharacterized membrane protein YgaE (UPF0421/DUF939 family)